MELPVKTPVFSSRKTPYRIETKNLSYKTSNTYVLKDVTCKIEPAELTAIAGPSGAGKTTLLEILAGKTSPRNPSLSGQVLVNGCPLDAKIFRRVSGYVTQDDALFPLLTVEETLMYSALLKLPCGKREAATRVKSLINELGLELVAGSRVGEGSTSGISGGERRRVSIGVELVHDPPIVLIDEPTSGLDSASALHVVALLKLMTIQKFKTIVLTIHQPGFRILELFDRLVLLSDGNVIHNGSLKLLEERLKISGHFIPPHINVLEFAIDVACGLTIQTTETNHTKFFTNGRNGQTEGINVENRGRHNSIFDEVVILGERSCKNIFRTKQLFATRVIQALFTGFTLGTIFMNVGDDQRQIALQARIGFFAFSLTFLLSSTTEALPIFLQERGILMRETSRGAYRVFSYVLSSTLIFLPFLLLVSLLYATPVYWLIGLRREADRFLYFTLVVWMVMLMSNSFTACFSALLPDFIMGNSVISGLMGCFFLFSGYFISKENLPKYWIFMHYLSMFKYPFECFMINEYGGKQEGRCLVSERGECNLNGEVFLRQQGLEESQKWSNLAVMLAFIVGYRVICFLILWYRCYRTRN